MPCYDDVIVDRYGGQKNCIQSGLSMPAVLQPWKVSQAQFAHLWNRRSSNENECETSASRRPKLTLNVPEMDP